MVNRQALEAYRNSGARKQAISVKPVAVPPIVKPMVKPKVKFLDITQKSKLEETTKDEQIASLEAQLAALKSLTVSTSEKKVS